MTLLQLQELMLTQDMTKVMNVLELHLLIGNMFEDLAQYEPKLHHVMRKDIRQDKQIKDDGGNIVDIIKVARLPLALQKKIVLMAAAFLGTPTIESTPDGDAEDNLMEIVNEIWDANKLDYKFMDIAKKVMSERHCAELWYTQDVDEAYWDGFPIDTNKKFSMRLLANSLGDYLYPVFDEYGVMIAFGRGYKVREIINDQVTLVLHFDLYTKDTFYFSKQQDSTWLFSDSTNFSNSLVGIPNPIKKIPVIYYSQPQVEWADVQQLIDRLERKISNHADTNDYYDSPIVFAEGDVEGFANKGESGKILQGKNGAKVSYLTWDSAPASMEMEIKNLQYYIHSLTHTPDISFENLKGLGRLSGITLQLLFMDAHLKAAEKEGIFGDGLQRRINYLKEAIAVVDPSFRIALPLKIQPKFKYFMPDDVDAMVVTLNNAVAGNILSEETAIRINPLVTDAESEITAVQAQKEAAAAQALKIAGAAPKPPPKAVPAGTPEPVHSGQ